MTIDPETALRRALSQALEDIGFGDLDDEQVEDLIIALKEHGYIVIREANGVAPGKRQENEEE
jgi:hypothetical protein